MPRDSVGTPSKISQIVADETNVAKVFKILTLEVEDILSKMAALQTEEVMRNVASENGQLVAAVC